MYKKLYTQPTLELEPIYGYDVITMSTGAEDSDYFDNPTEGGIIL